jgi:phosphatidylserine decarboxylase
VPLSGKEAEVGVEYADPRCSTVRVFDPEVGGLAGERVCLGGLISWAYAGLGGFPARVAAFRFPFLSRLAGAFCDSRLSRFLVDRFVRQNGLDLAEAEVPQGGYRSFNAFFTRRLKEGTRPSSGSCEQLCSPADCRAQVLDAGRAAGQSLLVKGRRFSVSGLLDAPGEHAATVSELADGGVFVGRLSPVDYHRFHFPAEGEVVATWRVPGQYHSVGPTPLRLGYPVHHLNGRRVWLLNLERFGLCAFVAVGAFGVGRIVQTHSRRPFARMQEAGYFAFGGSTIVMVLHRDACTFVETLRHWSAAGVETLVKAGQTIGLARNGYGL